MSLASGAALSHREITLLAVECPHIRPHMAGMNETFIGAAQSGNPLLEDWTGPFGVPPFARIAPEHFREALERGFAAHDAEIAAITADPAAPSFDNTIAALERSGNARRNATQSIRRGGHTIGFMSAKGGCGATTIACHTAVVFQQRCRLRSDGWKANCNPRQSAGSTAENAARG